LTEKKGVISLIDAWPIVVHRFPHAELHVFGKDNLAPDGSSMLSFLKLRLHNGDTGSVEFHGHVAREVLFEALAEARVAVFPSYAEALPLAPLEAMARACPTILSRTTAGREIVDDMRNGLLIDPGSPQAIAEAIVRLLSDDSLALQLGRKGRETVVSRFSVQVLLPRNETFFRRAISEYRGRKQ
jgi:glycosyltransferase involved in cell wall biosynthesis